MYALVRNNVDAKLLKIKYVNVAILEFNSPLVGMN